MFTAVVGYMKKPNGIMTF